MTELEASWPAGVTWVFQGTVAEDATVGTHVVSLTVTPGAGQEIWLMYAKFTEGAGTGTLTVQIDDGTNIIATLASQSLTTGQFMDFPYTGAIAAQTPLNVSSIGILISGTMRFLMSNSTATVSLTHTFAVAFRLKTSALPTATLADSVGTPTLTTNTNKVF